MPRHEQRDISFDVPRHWDDKTIVAYAAPPDPGRPGGVAANLVMTRDTLREGETLAQYADRQLAEMAKRVDAFALIRREETTLGGAPAVAIRFASRAAGGPIEQRLVVIEGRRRGVYCFTATTAKADAAQNEPLFERILRTIRFPAEGPDPGAT
jgi:hypothetical protein